MKFHDSGTSHRRTFFLKDRQAVTTLECLKTYKLESETVTREKMMYVRTDNAPEFKGNIWATFFNENGLIHIPTAPYSSSSNGTAERSIGISTAAVRAMLNDSRLPTKWWAEAWAFADYVENLLPSVRHPGQIPEERWTGTRQDVGHVRVWGCVAYVHIPKEKGGGKLADRGQKGRLIGIEGRGLYRVLISETGVIIRSRNVKFEEGIGHRTLTAEGEYFVDIEDADNNLEFLQVTNPPTPTITPTVEAAHPNPPPPPNAPNPLPPNAPRPRTRIVYPPASRKSSRTVIPSRAAAESDEYSSRELNAATGGSEWATDSVIPVFEDNDENDNHTALTASDTPSEPNNLFIPDSFADAFDQSRRHLWFPAMVREIQRWDDRGVVTPVARPPNITTIKTKWIYDLKRNGDGDLLRRRARGVVKGFTQKLGEHYFESFAAVVRYDSVRMLFALIAARGLDFWLIDFVGAYLNAKPQGENYLEIPEGFKNHYSLPGIDTVLKMNLTIYGTMDGANNWFNELNKTFNKLGHRQSRADPCIRIHHSDDGYTITSTYTDDVAGGSSSPAAGIRVREDLAKAYEITDLGRPNKCLGMSITVNDAGDISLHQKTLIQKILETFGMSEAKPKYTPLPPNVNLTDSQPIPIPNDDIIFMRDKDYRKALGMLNYLANGTRPDIAFAVSVLMRYASDPRPLHWRLVQRVIAYIGTTIKYAITYRKGGPVKPLGYSDASYADDPDSRKSSAGYLFMMANGPITWRAKTLKRVSTSTAETEYIAVYEAGRQTKWLIQWLQEVEIYEDLPFEIKCDNTAAITLSKNTSGHSRIKHIDVKHHWIREAVDTGDVTITYVPSDDNIADLFTKALPRPQFEKLVKMMGLSNA
jgi:hypothetical protein